MTNPILCLDFDGVIHDYRNGWQDGTIYGELTPGFLDWACEAGKLFDLVIYSSRSKDVNGIMQMREWIVRCANDQGWQNTAQYDRLLQPVTIRLLHARRADIIMFYFAHEKPPAFLTIDDRCIQFPGYWYHVGLTPEALRNFKPWMAE